jgi:hypothetical protein
VTIDSKTRADGVADAGDTPDTSRLATMLSTHRWSIAGLGGALVSFFVIAVGAVLVRAPLGHDEAVYAMRAQDLASGWSITSGGYWADYRAPGLPMMLSVTNSVLGMHVVTMRLTVVALGAVLLLGTWFIARHLGLRNGAAVAPFLVAICAGFTYTASTLLADVPGAAFGILAVAVYLIELDRGSLRWSFLVVPLATGWGTVARFGAPIMIGAGLIAAFVVAAPAVWRHRNWLLVAQSACLAIGTGLVVRVVMFTGLLSGSDRSPADANRSLISRKGLTPSSGFDDLKLVLNPWSTWPQPIWSKAVAVLFVFGLVVGVVSSLLPGGRPRAVGFGVVAGFISLAGVTASVGLVVANYLALSLPFWAIAAAAGYVWIGEQCARLVGQRRLLGLLAASLVVVIAGGLVVKTTLDARYFHHRLEISFGSLRDVSVDTGRQLGSDCLLVTGSAPQVGYYSGCRIVGFQGLTTEETLPDVLAASVSVAVALLEPDPAVGATAVLIRERGKRQPPNEQLLEGDGLGDRISEFGSEGQGRIHVWSSQILACAWTATC